MTTDYQHVPFGSFHKYLLWALVWGVGGDWQVTKHAVNETTTQEHVTGPEREPAAMLFGVQSKAPEAMTLEPEGQ